MNERDDLYSALQILYARLGTLASINNADILNPQTNYHGVVEDAGAALGRVETIVDSLRAELEYQYRRLDEARDAALKEAIEGFHHE